MQTINQRRRIGALGLVLISLILTVGQDPSPPESESSEDEIQTRMKEMQVKLREEYDRVVMPRLKDAKYTCDPSANDTKDLGNFEIAMSGATTWVQTVEIFGFSTRTDEVDMTSSHSTEAELIEQKRQSLRDAGYTDQQLAEMDASADDFKKKIAAIWKLLPKLLKEAFDATFRCCLQTRYPTAYPAAMLAAARQLGMMSGGGDPTGILGTDYMEKTSRCACAAGGTGWWGTITYNETFAESSSWETKATKGERTRKETYAATIDVRDRFDLSRGEAFDPAKDPINTWEGTATKKETSHSSGQKGCFKTIDRSMMLSGREKGTSSFGVNFTADGRYNVHYHLKSVPMTGLLTTRSRAVGCKAYNPSSSSSSPLEWSINPNIPEIEGVADPSNPGVIKGTKTVDIPEDKGKRTGTVTWHLFRCKKG